MNQRTIVMTLILFLLIVVGMFTFAYLSQEEAATSSSDTQEPDTATSTDRFGYLERINAKHYFIDGVHTMVGEVTMPTPCDLLESEARIAESFPEQITLQFSVINNSDTCIQQLTSARFQVEATASEDATFNARFEGRDIILNVIEAAPGEQPEEFELFLKG